MLVLMTLGVSLVSGLVPIVNAELYLLSIGFVAESWWLAIIIALAAAIGQMIAKVGIYLVARRGAELPKGKLGEKLERYRARIEMHPASASAITFASGIVGLPPLYLVSVAAGLCRTSLVGFALFGTLGRALRFYAVLVAPSAVMSWL
ncbi:MAG: hypothetical protein KJO07_14385 [Deltaproteobacteria bacterium]|nr:hypothetical protein [Deltaproteobacteria bacterium]